MKKWISQDFTGVGMQIDVFWTNPNLLGMEGPFQLFRPKNHLITCKTWYKSHKIPILCLKNPTQIGHMSFWERWKVISMLLLAHKWPIKLAGVHFMVRISDQRIISCCWLWRTTWTSFCDCKTSQFWHCFMPKEFQSAKTKAKGQVISKCLYEIIVWTKIFVGILVQTMIS